MAGMETSIEINRPVASVFEFFLDLERNVLSTDPKVRSVIKTTEGPVGPGTTYRIRQPVFGRIREQRTPVVAADANKRIDMEARFGPVAPKFSLYFEPAGGSTRVTFRGTSRPIGPFKLVRHSWTGESPREWWDFE